MPKYINKPKSTAPKTLSDSDWLNKLKDLMGRISLGSPKMSDVKDMFYLYNDRFLPRENGVSCGGCRTRVYTRLIKHLDYVNGLDKIAPTNTIPENE